MIKLDRNQVPWHSHNRQIAHNWMGPSAAHNKDNWMKWGGCLFCSSLNARLPFSRLSNPWWAIRKRGVQRRVLESLTCYANRTKEISGSEWALEWGLNLISIFINGCTEPSTRLHLTPLWMSFPSWIPKQK